MCRRSMLGHLLRLVMIVAFGLRTSNTSAHELFFHISNVFASHMVIQADRPVPLWGWDEKGSTVTVEFNGKKYSSKASSENGFWRIELPAMKASFTPYQVVAMGSANQMQVLEDVLFGDVILCSGQNNMQFTLDDAVTGDVEAQLANNYPYIRLTSGPLQGSYDLKAIESGPYNELGVINLPWSVASNETVVKPGQSSEWDYYSAVCWFTLRQLFDQLDGRTPLGGVVQAFGGSSIQFWSSPEAIQACGSVYQPGSSCCGYGGVDSCLYWSQIAPYTLGPSQFKHVLWYQGEQNAGFGGPSQIEYYSCALRALIDDWRGKLKQPNLPFGICLLAPWQSESSPTLEFAELRQVQLATASEMKFAYTVSTIDQGDPGSGDIHSPFKAVVGERAAKGALSVAYGRRDVHYKGPQIRGDDVKLEPPVLVTRTQQHINNKVTPTLSRALLAFSVQLPLSSSTVQQQQGVISNNAALQGSGSSGVDSKLVLSTNVECPVSLNIRGCESFAVLMADCTWVSVEASPVTVTRVLPATPTPSESPQETADSTGDGADSNRGGVSKAADAGTGAVTVTVTRSLVAHLENDILVLSLHSHFRFSNPDTDVDVTTLPEGKIVGVRGLHSDWPVAQLSDAGGLPADPFYLPSLVTNECAATSSVESSKDTAALTSVLMLATARGKN